MPLSVFASTSSSSPIAPSASSVAYRSSVAFDSNHHRLPSSHTIGSIDDEEQYDEEEEDEDEGHRQMNHRPRDNDGSRDMHRHDHPPHSTHDTDDDNDEFVTTSGTSVAGAGSVLAESSGRPAMGASAALSSYVHTVPVSPLSRTGSHRHHISITTSPAFVATSSTSLSASPPAPPSAGNYQSTHHSHHHHGQHAPPPHRSHHSDSLIVVPTARGGDRQRRNDDDDDDDPTSNGIVSPASAGIVQHVNPFLARASILGNTGVNLLATDSTNNNTTTTTNKISQRLQHNHARQQGSSGNAGNNNSGGNDSSIGDHDNNTNMLSSPSPDIESGISPGVSNELELDTLTADARTSSVSSLATSSARGSIASIGAGLGAAGRVMPGATHLRGTHGAMGAGASELADDEELEHVLPSRDPLMPLRKLLNHLLWNGGVLLAIGASVVFIVFKVALAQSSVGLQTATLMLTAGFTLEVILRIVAVGWGNTFLRRGALVLYASATIVSLLFLLDAFDLDPTLRDLIALVLQISSAALRLWMLLSDLAPAARALVSNNKARYTQHGYDLDLTYITARMVAMGLPSTALEGLYRNPISEVARFFNSMHPHHYLIINLCSEREYSSDALSLFHDRVLRFPFDDHNPCPLSTLLEFCLLTQSYLDQHPENVIAVHCKGGKGRTGTMCVAWLLYANSNMYAEQALKMFATYRTSQSLGGKLQGVSGPSQKRYIGYFEQLRDVTHNARRDMLAAMALEAQEKQQQQAQAEVKTEAMIHAENTMLTLASLGRPSGWLASAGETAAGNQQSGRNNPRLSVQAADVRVNFDNNHHAPDGSDDEDGAEFSVSHSDDALEFSSSAPPGAVSNTTARRVQPTPTPSSAPPAMSLLARQQFTRTLLLSSLSHLRNAPPCELVSLTLNHVAPAKNASSLSSASARGGVHAHDRARDAHNDAWNRSTNWSLVITYYPPVALQREEKGDRERKKMAAAAAAITDGRDAPDWIGPRDATPQPHDRHMSHSQSISTSSLSAVPAESSSAAPPPVDEWSADYINECNLARYNDTKEFVFPAKEKEMTATDDSITFDISSFASASSSLILSGDLKFQIFRGNLTIDDTAEVVIQHDEDEIAADGVAIAIDAAKGAADNQLDASSLPSVPPPASVGGPALKPFVYAWFWLNTAFIPRSTLPSSLPSTSSSPPSQRFVLRKGQIDRLSRDDTVDAEMNLQLDYHSPPRAKEWAKASGQIFHDRPERMTRKKKNKRNKSGGGSADGGKQKKKGAEKRESIVAASASASSTLSSSSLSSGGSVDNNNIIPIPSSSSSSHASAAASASAVDRERRSTMMNPSRNDVEMTHSYGSAGSTNTIAGGNHDRHRSADD